MRWIFFIIFVVLFYSILFVIKMDKIKVLKFCGIGFIATPIILILISVVVMFTFKILGKIEIVRNLNVFFSSLTISSMTFCILTLFNMLPPVLIDILLGLHRQYNSANMNRNPIKFVVNNKLKIQSCFSYLIFAGSIPVFYGIWFDFFN